MKKIIFTLLLTTSAMLFAKNENPIKKIETKKEAKAILMTEKTIEENQQQKIIKISTEGKQKELTPEEACIIELALGPVIAGPPYHCTQI